MRILSKQTLRFDDPNGEQPSVTVKARDLFTEVPDWVVNSDMFQLANRDGTVEVIENKSQESKAEKKAASESNVKPPSEKAKAAEGTDTVKAGK